MKPRPLGAAMALTLATAAAASQTGTPLEADWKHWRESAPVQLPPLDHPALVSVTLPIEATARGREGWEDLRVIDERGREVPYILEARTGEQSMEWRSARLLEVGFSPGESTQGIVELPADPSVHNALEIATAESDFFRWAEVSVRDEAGPWRIVVSRAPVYRFARERLDGNLIVRYPPSRARHIRVRILDGLRRFPLDGVRVAHEVRRLAERAPLGVPLQADPAAPKDVSRWHAMIEGTPPLASEVRFEVAQRHFHRAVRVMASDDGSGWRAVGEGEIYRIGAAAEAGGERGGPDAGAADRRFEAGPVNGGSSTEGDQRERLGVPFVETRARHWRIDVLDRNDPPLSGARAELFGTPRRAVFVADPGFGYRLILGNSRASAPHYDLGRVVTPEEIEAALPARPGSFSPNPAYVDPAPWSERNRFVVWIALAIAVAVLGAMALRTLRPAP